MAFKTDAAIQKKPYYCLQGLRRFQNKMISVIIPVYNRENTISKCLDSVIGNDYPDKEVIAVNDGSCDRSGQILQAYRKKG